MSNAGDTPDDRLRERAGQSRAKLWLLLEADRRVVAGLLVAVVFGVFFAVGYAYPAAEGAVRNGDSIDTLFQGFLTATITGVTLVLTLNQLVLSQELGAVGDQRERMEEAIAFRSDVADALGVPVSPARPTQFLRALVENSAQRAEELRTAVGGGNDDLSTAVADLTDSVTRNAKQVSSSLDGATFGGFEVISAALNFNYSWKVFAAQRIRERYGDQLSGDASEALDRLVETLELFGPAREHFKTLYFQWELIDLSRHILVASIPALLVSGVMVIFFDAGAYSIALAGTGTLVALVSVAATIALVPFLILLSYILRIATVTKHTLSIGPFILRETDDVAEVDWDRNSDN